MEKPKKLPLNWNTCTGYNQAIDKYEVYNKWLFDELLSFIDGERIIGADTKEEPINAQGKNQAYDIVEKRIKEILNEKNN